MTEGQRLATDGDALEQREARAFVETMFPSYERFWIAFVLPLRIPGEIRICADRDLPRGKGPHDVSVAQLHYSVLKHLSRLFRLTSGDPTSEDDLIEAVSRSCAASDIAFELLERFKNPTKYEPFVEEGTKGKPGGREARREWRTSQNGPLDEIYNYRNRLLHGRLLPTIATGAGARLRVPRLGRETLYVDWRAVQSAQPNALATDFMEVKAVLADVWDRLIQYLENAWMTHLLVGIPATSPPPSRASGAPAPQTEFSESFKVPTTSGRSN
jgi:hypothetical protein